MRLRCAIRAKMEPPLGHAPSWPAYRAGPSLSMLWRQSGWGGWTRTIKTSGSKPEESTNSSTPQMDSAWEDSHLQLPALGEWALF